ncbi:MAG: hypothetical protein JWR51_2582 [Devosia sp.]|uniref:hypothetical protein n=1 Tax=Devosia sp. TaxID=1871048 RepID=UPI002614132B|nr:hypothetical protein [Devosia sp.]MDB5529479.1 hypothetical protein [Devosia sp.]
MADYKELLRRAISALPENNGAARRAVYEKARAALVGQLRAITPPLPARDITQHRLQLEDCIRQVEQEASEAVISLSRDINMSARPAAPEPVAPPAAAEPAPVAVVPPPPPVVEAPKPVEPPKSVEVPKPTEAPAAAGSIEDIINQAAASASASVVSITAKPAEPKPEVREERPLPSIVARAEAAKSGPTSSISSGLARQADSPLKAPSFTPRREPTPLAANSSETVRVTSRMEPSLGNQALARQQVAMPLAVVDAPPVEAALSSVREVEVEPDPREAEGVIERAIETLDREARGEVTAPLADPVARAPGAAVRNGTVEADDDASDVSFAAAPSGGRSGAGLTIFLVVFVLLLAGVGGGGFWAWREGYVDLDQMFGRATTTLQVAQVAPATDNTAPTLDTNEAPAPTADNAAGPGNTATTSGTDEPTTALEGLEIQDRLEPTPTPVVPSANQTALPQLGGEEVKGEERLPDEDTAVAPSTDLTASVDPAILAGSQSLLLEASPDGRTGAVPFSGTIDWTEGVDEVGLPTLVGKANIPARNLGISMTIRKNADPSLPASHLMEVDFSVNDTFVGGTIAGLPGVLLKNEELVPGTPLVGASARVVGNSFLFALSASPSDAATNTDLLEHRKWMDLAVIYGTGRNAIITLEKDDAAQALFDKVFAAWAKPAPAPAP